MSENNFNINNDDDFIIGKGFEVDNSHEQSQLP